MRVIGSVGSGSELGRTQVGVARIEDGQDFRPFFLLVERTEHRQTGPTRSVPTVRSGQTFNPS